MDEIPFETMEAKLRSAMRVMRDTFENIETDLEEGRMDYEEISNAVKILRKLHDMLVWEL